VRLADLLAGLSRLADLAAQAGLPNSSRVSRV
jgi:hypothetical protein